MRCARCNVIDPNRIVTANGESCCIIVCDNCILEDDTVCCFTVEQIKNITGGY